MTDLPTVSLIVVSEGRPASLSLCLMACRYLDHPRFELIVVADRPGLAAIDRLGLADRVKTAENPGQGISVARNTGLMLAAGEIVAFLDDDAVPEPTWLSRLAAPFSEADVSAAGGFVRGRNGISFQWRARWVDAQGGDHPLDVPEDAVSLHRGAPGRAIKTEGTNMAFRRAVLAAIGGFDPAYRYFLDETDVNMRLAQAGHVTAILPAAQVQHRFAAGARRTAARAPRALFDLGASSTLFMRKYAPADGLETALRTLARAQRARLLRHMVRGTLEPGDVGRLMDDLADGIAAGRAVPIAARPPLGAPGAPFRTFAADPPPQAVFLAGRTWQARRLHARAAELARAGVPVTLFLFGPSARYHRMRFARGGYWVQSGGLFGRSDRAMPLVTPWRFAARLAAERARLAPTRPCRPSAEKTGTALPFSEKNG
ncbi:GT2 family glycosyltransferase [Rhodovulum iodosum]|uniref:GT2 family glycosyltransferase n=1 Tax=Rhodovulum iodosum TaxID=68291 RepID=A0ABV3XSI1_9RHOB|nr:glycosyltransferase family 2 protein [Rhodovulum robiginosum]RSK30374.1 glycosyltransferase [Rhodovulum robiginosum]